MITGINELKTKNKFRGRKYNSNQKWNKDKCRCKCKTHIFEKGYIWNPATCSCEKSKYLASVIDDLVITSDEIVKVTKKAITN